MLAKPTLGEIAAVSRRRGMKFLSPEHRAYCEARDVPFPPPLGGAQSRAPGWSVTCTKTALTSSMATYLGLLAGTEVPGPSVVELGISSEGKFGEGFIEAELYLAGEGKIPAEKGTEIATPTQNGPGQNKVAPKTKAFRQYTEEPAGKKVLRTWLIPLPALFVMQFPLGREPTPYQSELEKTGKFIGLALKTTKETASAICYMEWEE